MRRKWVYGSNTLISTIIFIAILVFVALIAQRHPWRLDLTDTGAFSLSEQTRNVLKQIDKPIDIKVFYSTAASDQAQAKAKAKDLLDTYRYYSKNINYEFVDPDVKPEIAHSYDVKTYGTLVMLGYNKQQVVPAATEEGITNALLKLSRKDKKKIYFLTGHGEHSVEATGNEGYSQVKTALEKNYFSVDEFDLLHRPDVPSDAAAVVIAGPKKPIADFEIKALQAYLDRGGKLFVMIDPQTDPGMGGFLKNYGIALGNDVIVDSLSRLFGASERMPVVAEYGSHKITNGFSLPTFYPDARSVIADAKPPKGVSLQVLAKTSPNSWAERDLAMLNQGKAAFDEGKDLKGPVPVMVLADITVPEQKPQAADKKAGTEAKKADKNGSGGEAKAAQSEHREATLVVAGNSEFAANHYFGLYGNGDLFTNAVNFLADEGNMITIEKHAGRNRPMLLTQSQAKSVFWIVLVLVPLAVLVSGLTVYKVRRAQR